MDEILDFVILGEVTWFKILLFRWSHFLVGLISKFNAYLPVFRGSSPPASARCVPSAPPWLNSALSAAAALVEVESLHPPARGLRN